MRRMMTTKQINLVEELSKYLSFDSGSLNLFSDGNINITPTDDLNLTGENTSINGNLELEIYGPAEYGLHIDGDGTYLDGGYVEITSDGEINIGAEGGNSISADADGIVILGNDSDITLDNGGDENNYIQLTDVQESSSIKISAYSGLELSWDDVGSDNLLKLTGHLPTSDPQVVGAVWNDNGVLKISAGQ